MSNLTDPVAEMKARAFESLDDYPLPLRIRDGDHRREIINFSVAFAAKEVERATLETSNRLKQIEEFLLGRDQRESPSESLEALILRATEAERLACAKSICPHCNAPDNLDKAYKSVDVWIHNLIGHGPVICDAAPIWERAHGKESKA